MWRFLAPLLGAFTTGSVKQVVKRTKTQMVYGAVIAGAVLFAAVFLCLLIFLGLIKVVSPIWAAAILCVFFVLVAVITYFYGRAVTERQKMIDEKEAAEERSALLMSSALAIIPTLLRNRKVAMFAVPLVGIAALLFLKGKGMPPSGSDDTDA